MPVMLVLLMIGKFKVQWHWNGVYTKFPENLSVGLKVIKVGQKLDTWT